MYAIASLRVLEYHGTDITPIEKPRLEIAFNVRLEFGVTDDMGFVVIKPIITGAPKDEPERILCTLVTEMAFKIENLEAYRVGNAINVPVAFWGNVINLALGAARGVLFAKNFGMTYAGVVLPVLNVAELIPNVPLLLNFEGGKDEIVKIR